jgi:glycosyl transferase family 25
VNHNQKFSVMVINLEGAHERWQYMEKASQVLNTPIERVAAVDGRKLSDQEIRAVWQIDVNQQHYKKILTKPEMGCYLSHVACWQKIVDEDLDFALILEDDADIDASINDYIEQLSRSVTAWDYIEMSKGNATYGFEDAFVLTKNLKCVKRLHLQTTTTAQLVSQAGARKLLKHALPLKRPVDVDLQHWYEFKLRCFSVDPLPVKPADLASQIRPEDQTYKTELLTHLVTKSQHQVLPHLYRKLKHLWSIRKHAQQLDLKAVQRFYPS